MQWPDQSPPGQYPPPPPQYTYSPPPLPADDRIRGGVRRGETFADPQDARRAVAYAEGVLKNGSDLARPPVLAAIVVGLMVTVALQFAVGNWFVLVVPVAAFLGLIGYVVRFALQRPKVEQSLAGNRQVAGL